MFGRGSGRASFGGGGSGGGAGTFANIFSQMFGVDPGAAGGGFNEFGGVLVIQLVSY